MSGTKRYKKIWDSIAIDMQKVNSKCTVTGQQCQSKLNGLKKTYKKILNHNSVSGNDRKTWVYFEVIIYLYQSSMNIFDLISDIDVLSSFLFQRMHEIFQNSGWANPKAIASEAGPSTSQISPLTENMNIKEKSKKRKPETALDDILEKMKDKQIKREEEKKENASRFETLMEQKKETT